MYDNELILISYEIDEDEIGNEIKLPIENAILCKVKDIGSTEFYNAQVSNLKPEIKFIVHSIEYQGEIEVKFEGTNYKVMRTYQGQNSNYKNEAIKLNGEEIELTCEKVLSSGN